MLLVVKSRNGSLKRSGYSPKFLKVVGMHINIPQKIALPIAIVHQKMVIPQQKVFFSGGGGTIKDN